MLAIRGYKKKEDMMPLEAVLTLLSLFCVVLALTIYLSSCKYLHILFRKRINLVNDKRL